jgi:predicted membrane channel-forming protein YqfA (hemolysin III family)
MREQSTREEQVNAVSHGAGVGLALAAFAALIVPNWSVLSTRALLALGLFLVTAALLYLSSLLWRFRERFAGLSLWWYLLMGWLILLALGPLYRAAPSLSLWYLGAGGLAYTAGVVFFVMDARRYFHGIWHLFVLAGTALQFWGIWLAVGS